MDEREAVLVIVQGQDTIEAQAEKIIAVMGLPKYSKPDMVQLLGDIKGDGVAVEEFYDEIVDFYAMDDDFPDEDFDDEEDDFDDDDDDAYIDEGGE